MTHLLSYDLQELFLATLSDGIASILTNESSKYNQIVYYDSNAMKILRRILNTSDIDFSTSAMGASDITLFRKLRILKGPHPNLHILFFTEIEDIEDISYLPIFIQQYPSIKRLTLGDFMGEAYDNGSEILKALAESLPRSNVTVLKYDYSGAGDEGYKSLASNIPKSSLKYLELWSNPVTIKAYEYLARALLDPNTKLETLNIVGKHPIKIYRAFMRIFKAGSFKNMKSRTTITIYRRNIPDLVIIPEN